MSTGRSLAVTTLLKLGARPTPLDRWGNTPADDARREGHGDVADLLADGQRSGVI